MEGVVYVAASLSNKLPPETAVYQSMVSPLPGIADKVSVPGPQRAAPVPPGLAGKGLTVAVTAVLVNETQPVTMSLAATK